MKLLCAFKRDAVPVRPWSRDILRFAVSHEKPDAKGLFRRNHYYLLS